MRIVGRRRRRSAVARSSLIVGRFFRSSESVIVLVGGKIQMLMGFHRGQSCIPREISGD